MSRPLAVALSALLLASGCWTNSAVLNQQIVVNARAGTRVYVAFENASAEPLDVAKALRTELGRKGFAVVGEPENADLHLGVTVRQAAWSGTGRRGGGGVGGLEGLRCDGGVGAAICLFLFVLIIGVVIDAASQPKEWLTGTVDLTVRRPSDEAPFTATMTLRYSCINDRPGTLDSVRRDIVEKVTAMLRAMKKPDSFPQPMMNVQPVRGG